MIPATGTREEIERILRISRDSLESRIALYRFLLYAASVGMTLVVYWLTEETLVVTFYFLAATVYAGLALLMVRRHGATGMLVYGCLIADLVIVCGVNLVTSRLAPEARDAPLWASTITGTSSMLVLLINVLRNNTRSTMVAAVAGPTIYLAVMTQAVGFSPPVGVASALIAFGALVGIAAASQSRHLLERFARYQLLPKFLSSAAVDRVLKDQDDGALALGGRLVTATMMSTDLRGFTAMSERMTPEQSVEQLNAYHGAMYEVMEAHGGVLDKFMGDGALAIFGLAPDASSSSDAGAAPALACGREMLERLNLLNEERRLAGLPPLAMGIGIHTGEVVVGNIGAPGRRLEFTVIGDAVNTSSRIEGLTKEAGVPLLLSVETASRLDAVDGLKDLGLMAIRGKAEPLRIYAAEAPPAASRPAPAA